MPDDKKDDVSGKPLTPEELLEQAKSGQTTPETPSEDAAASISVEVAKEMKDLPGGALPGPEAATPELGETAEPREPVRPAGPPVCVQPPECYMNPYLAGLLIGAVLLVSFLVLGAGLGASGGEARLAAWLERLVLPGRAAASEYFGAWGDRPLEYYLVFMVAGIFLGGLVSALAADRLTFTIERGRRFPAGKRLLLALVGGVLVGFASRLAQGCTSGQALTGGAQLMTGSLVFMVCVFASGYVVAWLVRRQWHD